MAFILLQSLLVVFTARSASSCGQPYAFAQPQYLTMPPVQPTPSPSHHSSSRLFGSNLPKTWYNYQNPTAFNNPTRITSFQVLPPNPSFDPTRYAFGSSNDASAFLGNSAFVGSRVPESQYDQIAFRDADATESDVNPDALDASVIIGVPSTVPDSFPYDTPYSTDNQSGGGSMSSGTGNVVYTLDGTTYLDEPFPAPIVVSDSGLTTFSSDSMLVDVITGNVAKLARAQQGDSGSMFDANASGPTITDVITGNVFGLGQAQQNSNNGMSTAGSSSSNNDVEQESQARAEIAATRILDRAAYLRLDAENILDVEYVDEILNLHGMVFQVVQSNQDGINMRLTGATPPLRVALDNLPYMYDDLAVFNAKWSNILNEEAIDEDVEYHVLRDWAKLSQDLLDLGFLELLDDKQSLNQIL